MENAPAPKPVVAWPVLVAIFLDLLGFGMIIPDIQTRAEAFLVAEGVHSRWVGLVIGFMLALTFIVQAVMSPKWGRLADRVGRKPILIVCGVLSAAGMLIYGLASSVLVLFLSRVVSGFGSANVAVAQALIAGDAHGPDRTVRLGRMSAAISAGLIAGPALGGFIASSLGNRPVGFIAGLGSLVGILIVAIFQEPGSPAKPEQDDAPKPKEKVFDLRLLGQYPEVRPLFLIAAVASFALATLEGTFGRLIKYMLGYDAREFGIVFSYESVLGVVISGLLLGYITKRICETSLLRWGYAAQGVGLALNPLAGVLSSTIPGLVSLLIASTFYAVGTGVANPTISTMTSRMIPEDKQGELFGLLQVARNFGFVVGPMLGGTLFGWHPFIPYVFAGCVSLSVAIFLPSICDCHPKPKPAPA